LTPHPDQIDDTFDFIHARTCVYPVSLIYRVATLTVNIYVPEHTFTMYMYIVSESLALHADVNVNTDM
jgi:hypothetical protein